MEKCNYFDYYLGDFYDFLEKEELLDNTLLIVCSDHKAPIDYKSDGLSKYTPLIIHYPYLSSIHKGEINQQDIYPTILDIMQISDDSGWRGIGYSIFSPDTINHMSVEMQQDFSNIILETNLFSIGR